MNKLDTLYKRAKTGKIVYYEVRTEEDEIIKETGQLFTTKPIVHKAIAKPKNVGKANETTGPEQAAAEAASAWRKKKDEGYKSQKDLGVTISGDLRHRRFEGVDYETLTELLEVALPKFNTDASGNIKPMLATDWEKVKKKGIPYPCLLQPKLDGVRCLMVVTEGEVMFLSRSGKQYDTLSHVIAGVQFGPDTFILDGEVYAHGMTLQQIGSAVKKQRPESLNLKFRAYDIINDEKQIIRWVQAHKLVETLNSDNIVSVPTHTVDNEAEVIEYHDKYKAEGYEGVMLRLHDGDYGRGQRSRSLLKVKVFDYTEFKFIGFDKGKRDQDLMVIVEVNRPNFGLYRLSVKASGTTAEKKELEGQEQELIGTNYTVKHFGYTDEEVPFIATGVAFRDYE